MVFTIALVIVATELLEYFFHSSEVVEGLMHVLVLSAVMAPLFYFGWFRPLTQQLAAGRACETQIRNLSHRLIGASEEERKKLARDLHDEFGQKLTSLQLQLQTLDQALLRGKPSSGSCKQLMEMVGDLSHSLRNVLSDLRPMTLDWLGLVPTLENLCNEVNAQETALQIDFRSAGIKGPLHPDVEIALYRATQEALTNVIRHARASRVEVCLARSHPWVILTIQDDGIGIEAATLEPTSNRFSNQFGLLGMRERVAAVGGHLHIVPLATGGTRIRIEVPESLLRGDS